MCILTKNARHRPYGELQPIPIPDGPWKVISWDFIQDLEPLTDYTETEYNEILVITDKLTKESEFIPWNRG